MAKLAAAKSALEAEQQLAAQRGSQVNELAEQVESFKVTLGNMSNRATDSQALSSLTAQLSERDDKIAVSLRPPRGAGGGYLWGAGQHEQKGHGQPGPQLVVGSAEKVWRQDCGEFHALFSRTLQCGKGWEMGCKCGLGNWVANVWFDQRARCSATAGVGAGMPSVASFLGKTQ